jgi:hypothetical protein
MIHLNRKEILVVAFVDGHQRSIKLFSIHHAISAYRIQVSANLRLIKGSREAG